MSTPKRARPQLHPPATAVAGGVTIGFVDDARAVLEKLPLDKKNGLLRKLEDLALNPKIGKPLTDDLAGCVTVTYGRYRAIATVGEDVTVVLVVALALRQEGSRKDPYAIARRRIEQDPDIRDLLARLIEAHTIELQGEN